jgi:hypothetical protein
MQESCYCGRNREIEDREPVVASGGGWALRCPDCGHLESLAWLSEEARRLVLEEEERRQPAAQEIHPSRALIRRPRPSRTRDENENARSGRAEGIAT